MADGEDPATAWTGVYCLRPYNPWKFGGQQNPAFEKATDGRLLDLKFGYDKGVAAAVEDFAVGLDKLKLPPGTILAIVPGHKSTDSNQGSPLARVAHALADADRRIVAQVDTLIRFKNIDKLAKGGDRSVQQHLNSMRVNIQARLNGATVLLLDDTVTTGHSIEAARALISHAGAAVAAVGLGRTVKYF
jgi:predicted amidophosphoribosyltransferase